METRATYSDYSPAPPGRRRGRRAKQARGFPQDWVDVAVGYEHTCGVRAGGLYCWGRTSYGQAASADSTTPVRVGTLGDWTSVSTANYGTSAVRLGVVYTWGQNGQGELGLGSTAFTGTPTAVSPGTWDFFGLGSGASCGVREGALYCWGQNFQGVVGDGTTEDRLEQTRVGTDVGWTVAVTGQSQSCGLRDGSLYCWVTTGISPSYGFGTQWSPVNILSPDPI